VGIEWNDVRKWAGILNKYLKKVFEVSFKILSRMAIRQNNQFSEGFSTECLS
jgi:hypothetical protein